MLDDTVKKFKEVFGEAIECADFYIALSDNSCVGLIENTYSRLDWETYTQLNMPKIDDDRFEVVKKGNLYFDFKILRTVLKEFIGSGSFSILIYTTCAELNVLMIDLKDCVLIIGEKIAKRPITIKKYEVIYDWNNIFNENKMGDDMIL